MSFMSSELACHLNKWVYVFVLEKITKYGKSGIGEVSRENSTLRLVDDDLWVLVISWGHRWGALSVFGF